MANMLSWSFCYTVVMVIENALVIKAITHARVNEEGYNEYCETETFTAICGTDEVILMTSAKYGRMTMNRCVDRDWGYLGCTKDVLRLADKFCSGRRSCQIPIPNSSFKSALYANDNLCPRDLKTYLETSYHCVKVETAESQSCQSSTYILPSSPNSGILANYITMETGKGSEQCPWIIQAKPGQRVNVTLYDFARSEGNDISIHDPGYDVCHVYAVLKDEKADDGRGEHSVCGGGKEREKSVHVTEGHSVEIRIISYKSSEELKYFLIKYEVSGCEDPEIMENAFMKRMDQDSVIIGCRESEDVWRLKCVDNQWEGVVGNCTERAKAESEFGIIQLLLSVFSLPVEYAIIVIIIVLLASGVVIVILGICCAKAFCGRKKVPSNGRIRHVSNNRKSKPIQAVQPTTKDFVPNTDSSEFLLDTRSNTDHDLHGGHLPPPPPFLMDNKDKLDENEVINEMPSPPPSPSATRKLPTPPVENPPQSSHLHQTLPGQLMPGLSPPPYGGFCSDNNSSPLSYNKQNFHNHTILESRNNPMWHHGPQQTKSLENSPRKLGHRRMPSDVCVTIEKIPRHNTSPYRTSPRSAGYNHPNPHSSFEFPPPPPEVLRQLSEPGLEKHRVRFQDIPACKYPDSSCTTTGKYQGLMRHNNVNSNTLKPINKKIKRGVSDNTRSQNLNSTQHHQQQPQPQLQQPKPNYGSFSKRILNTPPPTEATVTLDDPVEPKRDEQTYFELEPEPTVPYEYGYSVKTGQKFKVYHGNEPKRNGDRRKLFVKSSASPSTRKQRIITNSTV